MDRSIDLAVQHILLHLVWKIMAQVINSSTVASSEVQEQVEVGDEVSLVEFLANEIESEQKCAARKYS